MVISLDGFWDKELWVRILISFLCGFIIGLERQIRGKPVGVRTASLICMGSMNFVYLGLVATTHSPEELARILAQLITGIGFIGAGVIMTRDGLVNGVTSAACIWILAGLGATIGLGHYSHALAVAMTTIAVLLGFEYLESGINRIRKRFIRSKRTE